MEGVSAGGEFTSIKKLKQSILEKGSGAGSAGRGKSRKRDGSKKPKGRK